MRFRRGLIALATLSLLATTAACSKDEPPAAPPAPQPLGVTAKAGANTVVTSVGGRPFSLHVPTGYKQGTAVPLVVLLHGYTSSGYNQEMYLKITAESDKRGFLYAYPDGTKESSASAPQFWNATDACCNFYGSKVDDSGYLSAIITQLQKDFTVDPKRVYLIGHSNGAFMTYRFACDHADQIAAIVSLAGAMFNDTAKCKAARPVSVLEVHGTADERIAFNGDEIVGVKYPSVATTVADWRKIDGCADTPTAAVAPIDLVNNLDGAETTITTWSTGCKNGTKVELWTIKDGPHIPQFTSAFAAASMDFLLAQTAAA